MVKQLTCHSVCVRECACVSVCPRFVTERNSQKAEDPRRPQVRYRVHSALTSMREIEYCLYSTAMTLLGIICHNTHAIQ